MRILGGHAEGADGGEAVPFDVVQSDLHVWFAAGVLAHVDALSFTPTEDDDDDDEYCKMIMRQINQVRLELFVL